MRKYIALDFDGTCCESDFPEIGEVQSIHKVVHNFIRKAHSNGNCIILWTCRENMPERNYLDEAVEWCKLNDIPIDYVNENPENSWKTDGVIQRKIYAHVYIDDKALNPENLERLEMFL